jgi:hypothetical protein
MPNATPLLSSESVIVLKDGMPSPKVGVSFVDIALTSDAPVCQNLSGFSAKMKPALTATNCATCHNSKGTAIGERLLDMNSSNDALCKQASAMVDPDFLLISPLVSIPSKGVFGHPQLSDGDRTTLVQALRDWLNR